MSQSLRAVRELQLKWASDIPRDAARPLYAANIADNLFLRRLNADSKEEFSDADGAELEDRHGRPAKIQALMSSSALAVNFFDPWRGLGLGQLGAALNIGSPISSFRFEYKCGDYPVGPRSPNLDLLLTAPDGGRIGVESKFTEPYRGSGSHKPLTDKYLRTGANLWASRGLTRAQHLAHQTRHTWLHLDTNQLLKHLLGLASETAATVSLLYLWYDTGLEDAKVHRSEIALFRDLIEGERALFFACSYQEAFARLEAAQQPTAGWHTYMSTRYFPPASQP